jgi:hypothetical protein
MVFFSSKVGDSCADHIQSAKDLDGASDREEERWNGMLGG